MPDIRLPIAFGLTILLFIGCGVDGNVDATNELPTDNADRVAALTQTGVKLIRDADGLVVEADFRGAAFSDDTLDHLADLPRVRSVILAETPVTDAGVAKLAQISTLRNVDVRQCPISNAGIAALASLKDLRALRLSGKDGKTNVDDAALSDVAKLTKLRVLALDFLWVGYDGLSQLDALSELEELYLAKTLVDDETLAVLPQFPKLKKLRISQNQITSQGLAHLSRLKALQELDLSENIQLSDDSLEPLSGMTQLTRLNLWRDKISDAGASHLVSLTNMEWLNLDNTNITDAALPYLAGMQRLRFLHLGSTAVTDAGLKTLESLAALADLKVTRTAVTEAGVAELRKALPQVQVQLNYIGAE